jgi:ankyrin repeat protein
LSGALSPSRRRRTAKPLVMTNKAGNSPLHEAVRHHRGVVAVALLDVDPLRGHDLNEQMESPLHMAAREGLVDVVRIIVKHAWIDLQFLPSVSLSGTALHQAVLGGHIRRLLLHSRVPTPLRFSLSLIYFFRDRGDAAG